MVRDSLIEKVSDMAGGSVSPRKPYVCGRKYRGRPRLRGAHPAIVEKSALQRGIGGNVPWMELELPSSSMRLRVEYH